MEIISVMKTTLIIFLFLISILIYIVAFFKIKVEFELLIKNNLIIIKRIFLKKEKRKEIKISSDMLINTIREKFELHEKIEDVKISKFSIKDILQILEAIENGEIYHIDVFCGIENKRAGKYKYEWFMKPADYFIRFGGHRDFEESLNSATQSLKNGYRVISNSNPARKLGQSNIGNHETSNVNLSNIEGFRTIRRR